MQAIFCVFLVLEVHKHVRTMFAALLRPNFNDTIACR